jgi:U3 small nucleolar RNA-associated protein 7
MFNEFVKLTGAGEPNFDAFERNPFHTKSQRREAEVKALLEKVSHSLGLGKNTALEFSHENVFVQQIQPELISLDNSILGEVDTETLQNTIDKKPKYLKKADIQLAHRKKRKNAKLPKIKDALRTELNLKTAREQDEASRSRKKKELNLPSDDPLARFSRKK